MKKTSQLSFISFLLLCQIIFGNKITAQELAYQNSDINYSSFPNCTNPSDVIIYRFDAERIEFSWAGVEAPKNGIRYLVRFRYLENDIAYPWREKLIPEGRSCVLNSLDKTKTIEIEVKKLCDGIGGKYELSSDWVQVIKYDLNPNKPRSEFTSMEECKWILGATTTRLQDNNYQVEINSIAPPNNPFWRYEVQYKACVSGAQYQHIFILTGTSDTIISPPEGICEMAVRIIWGGAGGENYEHWCTWQTIIINKDNNPPTSSMPCGTGHSINISNTSPLTNGANGQTWTVSGLPFVVSNVTSSATPGIYSGKGILSFPFGNKQLEVEFTGIGVNNQMQVFSGTVNGVNGNLTCYKTGTNFSIGGDICIAKANKEGWNADGTWAATGLSTNPFGFDISGKYKKLPPYNGYKEGDPYDDNFDPNGFDANGINRETGSKYGPNGCSREGLDKDGKKCDPSDGKGPYWWMTGGGFSESGKKFVETLGETLRVHVIATLTDLNEFITTKAGLIDDKCTGFRTIITTNLDPSWNAEFVKGAGGKYFEKGMSKNFTSPPSELSTKIERRGGKQNDLEKAHVDLYNCDVEYQKYDAIIKEIELILTEPNITELVARIKNVISYLPKDKIDAFEADNQVFLDWLKEELIRQLKTDDETSFSMRQQPRGFNLEPFNGINFNEFVPNSSEIASTEDMYIEESQESYNQQLNYKIQQGHQIIFGKHRALWYEQDALMKHFMKDEPPCLHEGSKMPIILSKVVADEEQNIYFDNIVFGPNSGTCDIYFVVNVNTTGNKFVFQAIGVEISEGGLISPTKLKINNDIDIRINNTSKLKIKGNANETYVEFDCNGLKEISIDAEVEFCRNFLVPVDPATQEVIQNPDTKVKASFAVKMASWGQFMVSISIGSFAIANAQDIKWTLSKAILDFSDHSSPAFTFPPNYGGAFVDANGHPTPEWRGVFIDTIQATLPKKFSKAGSPPISVGAYRVIFDGMGFTGNVAANHILSIDDGSIGGWALSIDNITVGITKNELSGGSMAGMINVPTFTENLAYSATIFPGDKYEFKVTTTGEVSANLWAAKVILEENSGVSIGVHNGDFNILANLNGRIEVDGNLGGINVKVPSIQFENVQIGNKDPYFSPGNWSVTGAVGIKCGGFEITAEEIGLSRGETTKDVNLDLKVKVTLTDIVSGEMGGSASLKIKGKLEEINDKQKWIYDKIQLTGISIKGNISGNKIYGDLQFYDNQDNPAVGTGFKGSLHCEFKGLVELNVFATFGHFSDYKFFCVDAMAYLDKPIPMGFLSLYGFGGGIYNRMSRNALQPLQNNNYEPGHILQAGLAPSGAVYTPDKSLGLGLIATIALSASVKEAFNCNVTFGVQFLSTGGLSNVSIDGNARFMAALEMIQLPVKIPGSKPNGAMLSANMAVKYDFQSHQFDGDLEVYANVLGILKGAMPGDKMVDSKIHFGAGSWYIYVGTPEMPCGIKIAIPGLGTLAEARSYLDIGTDVPDFIPLTEKGFPDLKGSNLTAKGRNSGTGFVFGTAMKFGFDEKSFLMFYAKMQFDFGFDMMVSKFPNVLCSNGSGGSEALGINGWYAQGQSWANLEANVGIKVKVFKKKKKYEIFYLSAGVGMATKLPNPFYATGQMRASYRILGGLVKGKCNFIFEIGEPCDIIGENDEALEAGVILTLGPDDKSEQQEVTVRPEAEFSVDLNTIQEDFDENGNTHNYIAKLKSVSLKTKAGLEIPSKTIIKASSLTYTPYYFLPSNDTLIFKVAVEVFRDGVLDTIEERQAEFTTGSYPEFIPEGNINGSYPFDNMEYFYQKEFRNAQGFIKLAYGMPELFIGASKNDIRARFTAGGQRIESDASYDFGQSQIIFNIPNLNHNQDYLLEIIDTRKKSNETGDFQVLCKIKFHTSQFDYFKDKLVAFVSSSTVIEESNHDFILTSAAPEKFARSEIPMIDIMPGFNQWFMEKIGKLGIDEYVFCPHKTMTEYFNKLLYPDAIDVTQISTSGIRWMQASNSVKLINLISDSNKSIKKQNSNTDQSKKKKSVDESCPDFDEISSIDLYFYGDVLCELRYSPPGLNFSTSSVTVNLKTKTVK